MILLNAVAVVGYVATLIYISRKYRQYFIVFAYLSAMQLWALFSCFCNDLGVYNSELFFHTVPTLATARLGIFYTIFNMGFILAARVIGARVLTRIDYTLGVTSAWRRNLRLVLYLLVAVVVGHVSYSFITGGIPVLTGLDRLDYFEQAGTLDRFLTHNSMLIAFALGLFRVRKGRYSVNGLIFVGMIIYAVLIGHKFSFLVGILTCYYTPVFIRHVHDNGGRGIFNVRHFVTAMVICTAFVAFAYASYVHRLNSPSRALTQLVDRICTSQGQIWWAVDYGYLGLRTHDPEHWRAELRHIVSTERGPSDDAGMRYLMVQILGQDRAQAVFSHGYLYTMAYPAILLVTFPYALAIALQFAAGVVFFVLLYYLYYCIVYRHHFRSIVMCLVVFPYITMLFTGNFFVFVSVGMLVKFMVLTAMETGLFRGMMRTET